MNRNALLVLAAITLLAAAAVWLRPAPQQAQAVLRVASQRGSTRAIMVASGELKAVPYRIEWSEFPAASPLLEALSAGAVDVGGVGDAPFAFAFAAGAPITAVMALRSAGGGRAVAIVVPGASALRSVRDLAGHRVATVRGSVGHYLLIRALQRDGVPADAVTTVYLGPGEAQAALGQGAVDAWATWSPYISLATAGGANRTLVDGTGLFNGLSYIAANRNALAAHPAMVGDFTARLARALHWGQAHPAQWAAALAADTRLPLAVAVDTIARQDLTATPITPAVIAATDATLGQFRDAGVIERAPPLAAAFDARFNAAVAAASQ